MKQNGLKIAALYCRLSQDDGEEGDSSSITTQKAMLESFATENGFLIYDFYIDDGYSGLNFNRPDFQRMIRDIEDKKINIVITKDLSRLGRDYILTGYYTEMYFPDHGIRYIAKSDDIDTSKDNNDIAPFKNILNDMYAKDISRKVKAAKRQRMQQGFYISAQPPYGYKINPDKKTQLIVDEEAAEIVKLIFSLALTNIGVVKITRYLNEKGIVTPSVYKAKHGSKRFTRQVETRRRLFMNIDIDTWNHNTVSKILGDIVYLGDMENHKKEVTNYKTKKLVRVPDEDHIIVQNTHEAIISREDFEKVHVMIKNRFRPTKYEIDNLFKGILKCENCGRTLTLAYNKRRTGERVYKYRCLGNSLKHGIDTVMNSISYDEIYNIVCSRIKKLFENIKMYGSDFIAKITQKVEVSGQADKLYREISAIEKRLAVLMKLIKRLYEDVATEELSEENYQIMVSEYQAEQRELTSQLNEHRKKLDRNQNNAADNSKLFMEIAQRYLDFDKLTPEMVNHLIDHIVIGEKQTKKEHQARNIQIIYRFIR